MLILHDAAEVREAGPAYLSIFREAPPVAACDLCEREGRSDKRGRPIRHPGAPFGVAGDVCEECWMELRAEASHAAVYGSRAATGEASHAAIMWTMAILDRAERECLGKAARRERKHEELEAVCVVAIQGAFDFGDDPGRGPGGRAA